MVGIGSASTRKHITHDENDIWLKEKKKVHSKPQEPSMGKDGTDRRRLHFGEADCVYGNNGPRS